MEYAMLSIKEPQLAGWAVMLVAWFGFRKTDIKVTICFFVHEKRELDTNIKFVQ